MSDKLVEKSCGGFAEALASKAPVPGGGGVAALVGALGVSLCSMVGNLTTGRRKYAQYEDDLKRMLEEADTIQKELLKLIDKDAEAFEPLQKAYSIPKDDPKRAGIMKQVSIEACRAPLQMMEYICGAIDLLEEMRIKGSTTLISDVGCGALCSKAALECAAMNIFINTKGFDEAEFKDIEEKADRMLKEYSPKAQAAAEAVMQVLRR